MGIYRWIPQVEFSFAWSQWWGQGLSESRPEDIRELYAIKVHTILEVDCPPRQPGHGRWKGRVGTEILPRSEPGGERIWRPLPQKS